MDQANENSCLLSYFMVGNEGTDAKKRLLNDIAMQFMDEPTFN